MYEREIVDPTSTKANKHLINNNMKEAKEKAKELVDKFKSYVENTIYAQEYAIIAVDEIVDTLNRDIRDLDVRGNVLLDLIEYWQEVKEEINKL